MTTQSTQRAGASSNGDDTVVPDGGRSTRSRSPGTRTSGTRRTGTSGAGTSGTRRAGTSDAGTSGTRRAGTTRTRRNGDGAPPDPGPDRGASAPDISEEGEALGEVTAETITAGSAAAQRASRTLGSRGTVGTAGPPVEQAATQQPRRGTRASGTRASGTRVSGVRVSEPPASAHRTAPPTQETGGGVHRGSAAGRPSVAAAQADRNNTMTFTLPVLGTFRLPAGDELAFLGGVGVLAVAGVIEWPVAVALGAGHALAAKHRSKVLREFGEALEEA